MYRPAPQVAGMGAIDLSSLSTTDYLILGAAVIGVFSLGGSFGGRKPRRRRRKSSAGDVLGNSGWVLLAAGIAVAGYYAWNYGVNLGSNLASA